MNNSNSANSGKQPKRKNSKQKLNETKSEVNDPASDSASHSAPESEPESRRERIFIANGNEKLFQRFSKITRVLGRFEDKNKKKQN